MSQYVQRLRSLPIKVHWAGFESNTYQMERAGWTVSAIEDVASMQMRLAFTREGGRFNSGQPNVLKGITQWIPYEYYRMMDPLTAPTLDIVAEIQAVGSRVHLHEHGPVSSALKFQPVDCTPQMWSGTITGLDDFGHFVPKGNVPQPEDIIVPEDSVEELLEKILKMQEPAKVARATTKYYEERESGLMVPKVAAKIITLQDYKKAG